MPIACSVNESMPCILPLASVSRRKRSRLASSAWRSPQLIVRDALQHHVAAARAHRPEAGRAPTPKKPGPGSLYGGCVAV